MLCDLFFHIKHFSSSSDSLNIVCVCLFKWKRDGGSLCDNKLFSGMIFYCLMSYRLSDVCLLFVEWIEREVWLLLELSNRPISKCHQNSSIIIFGCCFLIRFKSASSSYSRADERLLTSLKFIAFIFSYNRMEDETNVNKTAEKKL